MDNQTLKSLRTELRLHARALGIPSGATDTFIDSTITSVQKSLTHKTVITSADLTRTVTRELKKYNKDLAYVYQKHDTII